MLETDEFQFFLEHRVADFILSLAIFVVIHKESNIVEEKDK